MDRRIAVKVVAAVCGIAGLGGAGAYALGGAAPQQQPAKVMSTEDGSAGSMVYRTGSGQVPAGSWDTIRRACPKGTHATGGGYAVSEDAFTYDVQYDRPYDSGDADFVPDDGWEVYVFNNNANPLFVSVRVICSK